MEALKGHSPPRYCEENFATMMTLMIQHWLLKFFWVTESRMHQGSTQNAIDAHNSNSLKRAVKRLHENLLMKS